MHSTLDPHTRIVNIIQANGSKEGLRRITLLLKRFKKDRCGIVITSYGYERREDLQSVENGTMIPFALQMANASSISFSTTVRCLLLRNYTNSEAAYQSSFSW